LEALFILFYVALGLLFAMSNKRKFFLNSISIPQVWTGDSQDLATENITAKNVYEAEDELFNAIGRPKRHEAALDAYFRAVLVISFGTCLGLGVFLSPNSLARLVYGFAFIINISTGILEIFSGSRRKPR
jgi:hypothetical protein